MSKPEFRVGRTLGTTIYRKNETQPCAIVMNGGDRRALAERIVTLLNSDVESGAIYQRDRCARIIRGIRSDVPRERIIDLIMDPTHNPPENITK